MALLPRATLCCDCCRILATAPSSSPPRHLLKDPGLCDVSLVVPSLEAFEWQGQTLQETPQVRQDKRTYPSDEAAGEGQAIDANVKHARRIMDQCQKLINDVNEGMPTFPQDLQPEMVELLTGLEGKVRQCAQVEAIGDSSVEADMLEWLLV